MYVLSASCLVLSSNWQHRIKWPHVAEHNMALGNFICKPPRSFGKVKRAVDVFVGICQASLLYLTKAAVIFFNSFSGQIITGLEKARRGPRTPVGTGLSTPRDGAIMARPKLVGRQRRLTGHKYLRNKLSHRDVSSRRFFL